MNTKLAAFQTDIWKCNKCGTCTSVCPLYQETVDESMAARGKIALIDAVLSDQLGHTPGYSEKLYDCLLCKACTAGCPSGVPTTDIFLAAREELSSAKGRPGLQDVILRGVLGAPARFRLGARLLRFYNNSGIRDLVHKTGLLSLLPRGFRAAEGSVPGRLPRSYRSRSLPQPAQPRGTVGYFLGCAMGEVFPDAAEAAHRVLVANGYRVAAPENVCCGMPHQAYGDGEAARDLAHSNIDLFAPYEVVVTDCASCGCSLKEYDRLLAGDPEYAERAKAFSAKVRDISEFLVGVGFRAPGSEPEFGIPSNAGAAPALRAPAQADWPQVRTPALRVTYHDPCHLTRSQGIRKQPRTLLAAVPGVELVEMSAPDRCCGGSGSFAITHPELSRMVGKKKGEAIAATGATVVASGCPACMMQLAAIARRERLPVQVVHPVELLARAYAAEAKDGAAGDEAEKNEAAQDLAG